MLWFLLIYYWQKSLHISYQRNRRGSAICKKCFQKCGVSSFFLINISSYLLSDSYNGTLFKSLHSVYVKVYWLIIFVFVNKRWKGLNKHRFIEMFWSIINIYLPLQKLKTNNILTYTPFRLKILNFIQECLQVFIKT